MKMSQHGLGFVKNEEGCILHKYLDKCKLPTIGVGHLLTKSELASGKIVISGIPTPYSNGLTLAQCLQILAQDLIIAETAVNTMTHVPLNQNQFDALVDFTFNAGDEAFEHSTLLKLLNQSLYGQVPAQLQRWDKGIVDGQLVVIDDLKNRRLHESALWSTPVVAPITPLPEPSPKPPSTITPPDPSSSGSNGSSGTSNTGGIIN